MELNPFKIKNKKKQLRRLFTLFIFLFMAVIVIIQSYALYEVKKEYDVIEGSVPSHMDNFDVKVALTIDGTSSTAFPEKGSDKTVDSITCDKGATASWDYEKWDIIVHNIKQTKTKCQVNFVTKYTDSVLNGNDPVLAENLIPVTIENQNGENVVKKASQKDAWYDYTKKEWANAVILKDENETYKTGEQIPEDKIESYFVWIPKFDYKIFSITKYAANFSSDLTFDASKHAIDIRFSSKSTTDTSTECKSPNKSGNFGTCNVGDWMTHPAFVDGFEGIRGMWVGKFETSRDTSVSSKENEINSEAVQIQPNQISWRGVQLAHAFYSAYDYKRELDSHMMKNTEWGAVAYLTQSIYGRCSSLTNCTEVRINNNSDHITGFAALHEPTTGFSRTSISCTTTPNACNEFGNTSSVTRSWNDVETLGFASTNGNVSGIYDVSGGAYEYVMGSVIANDGTLVSGTSKSLNSNFIGTLTYPSIDSNPEYKNVTLFLESDGGLPYPQRKYYDLYPISTGDYYNFILGDATGEMGPFKSTISSWWKDRANMITAIGPWFVRGGACTYSNGTEAGIFTSISDDGRTNGNDGFRVILSP